MDERKKKYNTLIEMTKFLALIDLPRPACPRTMMGGGVLGHLDTFKLPPFPRVAYAYLNVDIGGLWPKQGSCSSSFGLTCIAPLTGSPCLVNWSTCQVCGRPRAYAHLTSSPQAPPKAYNCSTWGFMPQPLPFVHYLVAIKCFCCS